MSVGLIAWCRSFEYDAHGNIVRDASGNPQRVAHPPSGLWRFLQQNAKSLAGSFDVIQLPPASLAQGGTGAGVDGYEAFEYRNFNGTHWGSKEELMAAIGAMHAAGMQVFADLPFHQMGGENGGPGVFKYNGRRGETTASWFQGGFGNGDPIPPFVRQDDIPSMEGNFPFGRPRSYENSVPHGVVEADTVDILNYTRKSLDIDGARWDDVKATHAQSVKRIMDSQPGMPFYGEYFDGDPRALNWYATATPMNSRSAVSDFCLYWRLQSACNGYDATQLDRGGGGFWNWNSGLAVGFPSNPDVATSWGPGGTISQQIAFNLLLAYAYASCLPLRTFFAYAEDYFPASPNFPTGRGLKQYIDNILWFARTFAFGKFERRWVDRDVYCYTRDGNGGASGWSGGMLMAINFNTLNARTISVDTMWPEGTRVHNYSMTGHNEFAWVGAGGRLTITIPSNAYSNGHSWVAYAPAGVNHSVAMKPRTTRQTFFGEADLDIGTAKNGSRTIGRVYCAQGRTMDLVFSSVDKTAEWPTGSSLKMQILAPSDAEVISIILTGPGWVEKTALAREEGWHSLIVVGKDLPAAGAAFTAEVTYTGAWL